MRKIKKFFDAQVLGVQKLAHRPSRELRNTCLSLKLERLKVAYYFRRIPSNALFRSKVWRLIAFPEGIMMIRFPKRLVAKASWIWVSPPALAMASRCLTTANAVLVPSV